MALTKEDLQAIQVLLEAERENTRQMMREENAPIKADIEQIKEDVLITREASNKILEWIDEASGIVEVRFPVKKKQA